MWKQDSHKKQESVLAENLLERWGPISLEKDFVCFLSALTDHSVMRFQGGIIYDIVWLLKNCHDTMQWEWATQIFYHLRLTLWT